MARAPTSAVAARAALDVILSVIPIAGSRRARNRCSSLRTTVAWETFAVGVVTGFIREVGLQAGVMFLALAGLEAAVPYALSLFSREGRARFGRAAAGRSADGVSIGVIALVVQQFIANRVPSSTR